ncbi:hypothetical protein GUI12_04685 [Anaplasmataceae bacterium AB001_6]|nr:hypothetical protein GUI12_04685 [Anaplasmataceae bacterium AB001_6]
MMVFSSSKKLYQRRCVILLFFVLIPYFLYCTDTVTRVTGAIEGFFIAKAFAAGTEKDIPPHMNGRRNILATFPICQWDTIFLMIAGATGTMVAIIIIASTGIGIPVAIGLAASLAGLFIGAENLLTCVGSMVYHPVYHDKEGNMLTCSSSDMRLVSAGGGLDDGSIEDGTIQHDDFPYLDDVYTCDGGAEDIKKIVNEYSWPENAAPYSDYIRFCTLYFSPMPFIAAWSACGKSNLPACYTQRHHEFNVNVFNQSSDDISVFGMKQLFFFGDDNKNSSMKAKCYTLKEGQSVKGFYARHVGSKICAYHKRTLGGADILGCHPRNPAPPAPLCATSVPIVANGEIVGYDDSSCHPCYLSRYCVGNIPTFAKAPYTIMSVIIPCIQETFAMVVEGCGAKDGILLTFTKYMRNVIGVIVTLSLILLGYKTLMNAVKTSDFVVYVVKVVFVYFLILSDVMSGYYDALVKFSNEIAGVVFSATSYQPEDGNDLGIPVPGGDAICGLGMNNPDNASSYKILEPHSVQQTLTPKEQAAYSQFSAYGISTMEDLENNYEALGLTEEEAKAMAAKMSARDYSYVMLWDQLDCRVGFYLGAAVNNYADEDASDNGGLIGYIFSVIVIIVSNVFMLPYGWLFALLLIIFVTFILMMVLLFVETYLISFVSLTLAITFAPIFIPMMLFSVTKQFFDNWIKIIIAFSLYPIILFAYLALVMIVLDAFFFGELEFKEYKKNTDMGRTVYNYYLSKISADGSTKGISQCIEILDGMTGEKEEDSNNVQYIDTILPVACIVNTGNFNFWGLFFGIMISGWTTVATFGFGTVMLTLARFIFVLFLFNVFLSVVGHIAAELAGTPRVDVSSHASLGKKLKDKVANGLQKVTGGAAKKAMSAGKSLAKAGKAKISGKGK